MRYPKSIFLAVLYYVFLNIIGLWVLLIPVETKFFYLLNYTHFVNSLIGLVSVYILFRVIKRVDLLKHLKTDNKFYIIAVALGIVFVFSQPFLKVIYYQKVPDDFFSYKFSLENLSSLSVLTSILIVPITEELFFRNYLQRELVKAHKPIVAIVLASFLFALMHVPIISLFLEFSEFNMRQAYIALFGGVISGILLYKSKSITPSIIFHMIWNLTSWVLV